MDLSTDLIRTFVALCQLKNFSKAAKTVHKSQAAVSSQIAVLEERAGLKFFDRSERPLKLTEAGAMFLSFSLEFLNKVEELNRLLKELTSGVMGEVKIAASTSVGHYLLAPLVAAILKKSPKLNLTVSVQPRLQVCESVQRADQDFGLILTDAPPSGLVAKSIRKEPLCFLVSSKHSLTKKQSLSTNDLRTIPFIAGVQGSDWNDMINKMLKEIGIFNPFVRFRINDYQAIKEAVRANLGVAILPEFTIERELRDQTLYKLNVRNARLSLDIMLLDRLRHPSSPAVTAVKSFLETNIATGATLL
jgi:DNA-binding transcriptional LysR family regulator